MSTDGLRYGAQDRPLRSGARRRTIHAFLNAGEKSRTRQACACHGEVVSADLHFGQSVFLRTA